VPLTVSSSIPSWDVGDGGDLVVGEESDWRGVTGKRRERVPRFLRDTGRQKRYGTIAVFN
jgi:hypothetical protein